MFPFLSRMVPSMSKTKSLKRFFIINLQPYNYTLSGAWDGNGGSKRVVNPPFSTTKKRGLPQESSFLQSNGNIDN
jgi:hypothetical protein